MSPYTIVSRKFTRVLVKKKQLESRQRQLGKTAVVKAEAYIVSMDRKTTVYRLEAAASRARGSFPLCISVIPRQMGVRVFRKRVQAVYSNAFPYFTGLPKSSSLYRSYSSRAGLHNSARWSASPL